MPVSPILLWFRQDLRLADNPAFQAALAEGPPVVPIYIWDEVGEGRWPPGAASRWWLHHSLRSLEAELNEHGSRLVVCRGASEEVLRQVLAETQADAVYWNRRYEPAIVERDSRLKRTLREDGVRAESSNSALLFEPTSVKNRQGGPFQVFTPFWRTCLARQVEPPVGRIPASWPSPARWPTSLNVDELGLLPRVPWDAGLTAHWTPGEAGARKRLQVFLKKIQDYSTLRDFPAADATSSLSPHLHFGEIGPRQIWASVSRLSQESGVFPAHAGAQKFLGELGWREFAHHLLFHFPDTPEKPLRAPFERFPWDADADGSRLQAWKRARTGYPIVDAGLRQSWAQGWMPNRLRMIVGSFLVKHLRLPWQAGAAWFWDTLVDADLANNTLGWQWVAGCGADAAPYFRIFAPVLQSRKFDPDGAYLRRWVPELANLPAAWIHAPWEAPAEVLSQARVELGRTYPFPIVDHVRARAEALEAYRKLKE